MDDVIFFVSAGFDAMANDGFGTQHLPAAWYRWFVLTLRCVQNNYSIGNSIFERRWSHDTLSVTKRTYRWTLRFFSRVRQEALSAGSDGFQSGGRVQSGQCC
jgi:hypothetical protein